MDPRADGHVLWRRHLSAADRKFLSAVAAFTEREVAPHAEAWERSEELPRDIFTRAGRVGLMGVTVPKALGGRGLSYAAYALAIREVAQHQAALAIDIAAHNALATGHILRQGSRQQVRRVVPKLASGEWIGAWALTEPEAGSDTGGIQTSARRKGAGWELNGAKRYITLARKADVLVVMAATGKTPEGKKEISAFLVARDQIRPLRKVPTCGLKASETSEFELVRARGELLGPRGTGQSAALACLDKGRIGVAAVSLGLGQAALDAARAHALHRRQFGKALAEFQAIQFMLADCATELAAAELLVLHAAALADAGERHTRESAQAKLFASEAGSRVCNRALQIHGGTGYTRDLPLERYWRDARLSEIGEGSSEVQRIVISRQLLREPAGT